MASSAHPPVRALVIGAGVTSSLIHLPILAALQKQGAVVLASICDLDEARSADAQRKFSFEDRCSDAHSALARRDVDAVYVFGSARMHLEFGLRALHAGKHVFVEKPIAPSWAGASLLAHAARERGLVCAGGHNRRFQSAMLAALAHRGKARWRSAEAVFHKPSTGVSPPFGARSWLSANGIHALDALLFAMGGPPESLASYRSGETFSAIMRWHDGAQAAFLCDNNAGERLERYAFHAPGMSCTFDDKELAIASGGRVLRSRLLVNGNGFEAEHRAFLDSIGTGVEPDHSLRQLAPSLFLAERIEEDYTGAIHLPAAPAPGAMGAPVVGTLMLDRIPAALARLPAGFSTVSVDDIARCADPRPDVRGAVLGRGSPPLTNAILDKLPNLRVVGVAALSLARYDPDALLNRGIAIVNASGAYAESVADFALGLAILGRRRAFQSNVLMRAGGWGTSSAGASRRLASAGLPVARALGLEAPLRQLWRKTAGRGAANSPSHELRGATAGLIGWGANARAFARRLTAAGANVLVYSEHAHDDEAGPVRASLGDVLASDIVSLHRGLTPQTRHFLGEAELARLRPGALLINIARGELIEPDAFLRRLGRGDIFACIDTFEIEPLPKRHALRRLPNVFLTSHIAGGSADMHAEALHETFMKIERFLAGQDVNVLSKSQLATMT